LRLLTVGNRGKGATALLNFNISKGGKRVKKKKRETSVKAERQVGGECRGGSKGQNQHE